MVERDVPWVVRIITTIGITILKVGRAKSRAASRPGASAAPSARPGGRSAGSLYSNRLAWGHAWLVAARMPGRGRFSRLLFRLVASRLVCRDRSERHTA